MPNHYNIVAGKSKDLPVFIDVFLPESTTPAPVVLFFPGFKGFRKWGLWSAMAERLCAAGIAVVNADFSHSGVEPPDFKEITNTTLFAQNLVSTELNDMQVVMDWVKEHAAEFNLNTGEFTLMGHSKGGGEAILFAADHKDVSKLIVLAPLTNLLAPFKNVDSKQWETDGFVNIENKRTGALLPVNYTYRAQLTGEPDKYDIILASTKLEIPFLIIHGEKDEAVPVSTSELLYQECLHAVFLQIENTGHTFGVSHPWPENEPMPSAFSEVIDNIIGFIQD